MLCSCRNKAFHPCVCKDSHHLALAVTFLPLWMSAGWQVSRSYGQGCMQLSACQIFAFCGSIWPQTGLVLSLQGKPQQKEGVHRGMSFSPFSSGSVTVPFLSLWRESGFSFRTFTGLPCAWPEEEYWVFLENFQIDTNLIYLLLWAADFPSNVACSSQVIFSQIFLAIQYISISKAFIGKHENKRLFA